MKIQHNQLKKILIKSSDILLTGLLVYYKKMELRSSQKEETHKARYQEGVGEFQTHHPPSASTVHGPGSSLNPIFSGVLVKAFGVLGGGFITRDVTD